ncbi:ATP-binding protein [Streptomyces purpureus]|uniref:ATP-binding protein n=1 Tax=Streptomyces purpureus TaxID=1951 RepID=UPI000363C89F|nr:ATP-binding protein [Streptomyces purpureus]
MGFRTDSRRFPVDGGRGVVGTCRDLTRQVIEEWCVLPEPEDRALAEDVLLLVSEVVTNACTHGGSPYELRIDRADGRLWIQVSDTSAVRPQPHRHRAAAPSGHGLYLLQRLSTRWGWAPRATGKAVWFEMPAPR